MDSYDYVIVGGGNAGLVIAARLAEDPSTTVCVIEAGEDVTNKPEIMIPGMSMRNLANPEYDWIFMSTPQAAAGNRQIPLFRGKGLGGSTILNIMQLGRGHAKEYDSFGKLGLSDWSWKDILKYFKKSETFTVSAEEAQTYGAKVNPEYAGTTGPVQRSLPKWTSALQSPFMKTMESLGLKFNPDPSSGNNTGIWNSNHSVDHQSATRSSSASAYYEPIKGKTNLKVYTGAFASRILLKHDKTSGNFIAEGVQYTKGDASLTVYAKKEVILSAGTFQTPQLLELSGIGKSDVLKAQGVSPLIDLPGVGENLQDHFWCPFTVEMDEKYDSFEVLADPGRIAKEMQAYQESKTGMLSTASSTIFAFVPPSGFASDLNSLNAIVDSVKPKNATDAKSIELQKIWWKDQNIAQLEFSPFPGLMPAPGKTAEPGKRYFSFFMCMLHPFSRGSVHISSPDFKAPPAIDLGLLDNEADLETMVQILKFARKAARTEPLNGMLKEAEIIPGSEVQTDEQIKEWIRNIIQTTFHPIGTAAMLPREEGGVVDSTLKVYGTSNLRVIDASILPVHISGHTQSTVYALAEKGADIIKGSN